MVTATAVASSSRKSITEVGLSLRAHFTPFSLPPIEEVVAALHNTFPNEPGMIVQQLRGRGQGLFKVTLTSPIEDVAPYKATFTGQVEDIEMPITVQPEPSSGYRGQKTGTLVTFVNASSVPLATVQNDTFDKDRIVAKAADELNRHPDKHFTIINLIDDPRKPAFRPDQALVAEYLERGLDKLHAEQVTVVHMPQKLEEVDKTGHHTERATKEIIQCSARRRHYSK